MTDDSSTMTDAPDEPAGEPLTVGLVEVEGGTEMTVVSSRHGFTDEQVAATIAGFNGFFDVMEKQLA